MLRQVFDQATTYLGAVATVAAAYAVVGAVLSAYRRGLGSRHAEAQLLSRLACGVTSDYVRQLLGPATFAKVREIESRKYQEQSYRLKHCWVATLETDSAVAAFSVTVTDARFRWSTAAVTMGCVRLVLGADSFARIDREPVGRLLYLGARRFHYCEALYFGNPGAYQYYVLSYNDAGAGHLGTIPQDSQAQDSEGIYSSTATMECPPLSPSMITFASGTTVNTVSVFGSLDTHAVLTHWDPPGVDLDVIRVLSK